MAIKNKQLSGVKINTLSKSNYSDEDQSDAPMKDVSITITTETDRAFDYVEKIEVGFANLLDKLSPLLLEDGEDISGSISKDFGLPVAVARLKSLADRLHDIQYSLQQLPYSIHI